MVHGGQDEDEGGGTRRSETRHRKYEELTFHNKKYMLLHERQKKGERIGGNNTRKTETGVDATR